jgi:hypothetical protein
VKRRNCLVGTALSACLLASVVAGTATAATGSHGGSGTNAPKTTKTTKVTCSTSISIAIANGDTQVLPPVAQGDEYGTARCNKVLGSGVQRDVFNVPASGDSMATYVLYFGAGSLKGTYDLTAQSGGFNFLATDWTGTLKVLAGTGAYKGVTGTGTMTCSTLDGIHTTCTDKLKLKGLSAG